MISSMQRSAADQTHVLHINIVVIVITVNRASNSHLLDDSPGKCLHDGIYGVGECTLEYSIEFRPLSTIGMNVISPHAYTHTEYSQQNRLTPSVYGMCSSTYKVAVAVTMVVVLVVRIYFVYFFFYLLQARYVRIVLQYSTPSIPLIPFHPSSFKIIPIINDQ